MERVLPVAVGDSTVGHDLSALFALPMPQGSSVRGRRYLLDEPMDVDVPLDDAGLPLFVFAPFPQVGQSQAYVTRQALDDALSDDQTSPGELSGLLAEHQRALCSPMTLPYWLVHLPGEGWSFLTAICVLSELVRVEGERIYGMSNGWVLHVYPPGRRSWRRPRVCERLVLWELG